MIEVFTDPARRLVRARMGGMLSVAEVEAFGREEQDAVRAMGLASGAFDLLIETEGNLVQTQDVMDAFVRLMADSPLKARRIATVRAGVLTRMQSKRVSRLRTGTAVFDTVAEAEAWLAEP
jgi:hypothetical protein